jgi:hypothetical protein
MLIECRRTSTSTALLADEHVYRWHQVMPGSIRVRAKR